MATTPESPREPFQRAYARHDETADTAEVQFERARGIDRAERRDGYVTISVGPLAEPVESSRIAVLLAVANAGASVDFLKLDGPHLSFVGRDADAALFESALATFGHETRSGRSIVIVHAANMRDEEGLIAQIVAEVIGSGVEVDHIGDMHDRVLLVTDSGDAERLYTRIVAKLEPNLR